MEKVQKLPEETIQLDAQIAALNSEADYGSELQMPLSDTMDLYNTIEAELLDLERKTSALISILPKRKEQLDELRREMAVNEASKEGLEKQTSDVVRKRQGDRAAGKADRENTGQWWVRIYYIGAAD